MVKIKNVFGDEYKGKQGNAVYQKFYGKQIRRLWDGRKKNDAPGQREQQERFKVGLSWYSSLSYVEKEGLKQFLNERGINLTAQQYAIKIALDRGRVTKRVKQEQIITSTYKAGWDAEGWLYRQWITITNNNSYDLIDYQVKIILDGSNVGPNFDWSRQGADLRFYDSSGNKLSYYVESWDEVNQQATVWVKVPSIPANGQTTIYMYYGNPSATSESDGEAVFDFFDDFNDLSKWELYAGNPGRIENGWLVITNQTRSVYLASAQIPEDAVIECHGRDEILKRDMDLQVGIADTVTGKRWVATLNMLYYLDIVRTRITEKGFEKVVAANIGTQQAPVTGVLSLIKKGNTLKAAFTDRSGANWETGELVETSYDTNNTNHLMIGVVSGSADTIKYDWVRVRKYAEVEPNESFGSEEDGIVEGYTTIQIEHILIGHAGINDIYILDENEEEITRFTNLSNLAEGDIKTRWDWVNDTGKTARYVIITSLAGTINKVKL